jgi:hypothetical protein
MQTYSHSGGVPVVGGVATVLAGVVAAVLGGFVYGYAFYYIPIIFLNILVTLAFAAGIGMAVAVAARAGKVRNNLFVGTIGLLATFLGMYVYWGAYCWALLGIGEVGLFAFTPMGLIAFGQELFENGSWGLRDGDPIKGWFLVAMWVAETGMILFVSMMCALLDAKRPFCEACREWTEIERGVARLAASGNEPQWAQVLAGDLPALAAFPPADSTSMQFVRLDVARCPRCEQSRFLSITAVQIIIDKKGKTSEKERTLVTNAILTPAQFAVVEACATLYENHLGQLDSSDAEEPKEAGESAPAQGDA